MALKKKADIISEAKNKINLEKVSGRKTPVRLYDDYRFMPHIHKTTHEFGGRDEINITPIINESAPITGDYTASHDDNIIEGNGTLTVTLYASTLGAGLTIVNIGTGIVTISGQTINGESDITLIEGEALNIYGNATEWRAR